MMYSALCCSSGLGSFTALSSVSATVRTKPGAFLLSTWLHSRDNWSLVPILFPLSVRHLSMLLATSLVVLQVLVLPEYGACTVSRCEDTI